MHTENHVANKGNFAQESFWKAVIGHDVTITIDQIGTIDAHLHQVDEFNIIIEDLELHAFMLVHKSAVIAVQAPDTVIPSLSDYLTKAVQKIKYKPSEKRTLANKNKKPNSNKFHRQKEYSSEESYHPVKTPSQINTNVQYKKTRSYERPA